MDSKQAFEVVALNNGGPFALRGPRPWAPDDEGTCYCVTGLYSREWAEHVAAALRAYQPFRLSRSAADRGEGEQP